MKCIVYSVEGEKTSLQFNITFHLTLDSEYLLRRDPTCTLMVWTRFVGLARAELVRDTLSRWMNEGLRTWYGVLQPFTVDQCIRYAAKQKNGIMREALLRELTIYRRGGDRFIDTYPHEKYGYPQIIVDNFAFLWKGRSLLFDEVVERIKALGDNAVDKENGLLKVAGLLQLLYLENHVKRVPGIELNDRNEPIRCNRCGCQDKMKFKESSCFRCEEQCFVCEHCLMMGRSKTCTPLFHFTSALTPADLETAVALSHPDVVPMKWTGQYTPAQQAGTDACLDFIRHSEQREMLVWAVCGAGKTEIVFPAIQAVLQKGKKVLIATPRKDVVLELSPRIKHAFPTISIVTLHGDSVEKRNDGQLFVSTTHQVLRFHEMFDLIIIDEIDAFPFSADSMLHYAVRRALKQNGKWMYLSATPPRELQLRAQRGDVDHVIIPARHHRCPLPVPVYCQIKELRKKIRVLEPIPLLSEQIQQAVDSNRQLFLFVPRVEDVALVTQWVSTFHPYGVVAGTYAHDPERTDKVRLLREGKINIFITTTILERGVTVPRTDCLIFSAHHPIFNETSLVQMAGRVGRSSDFPDGNVWFVAEERTLAQKRAIEQIKRMNQIAKRDGFIDEER